MLMVGVFHKPVHVPERMARFLHTPALLAPDIRHRRIGDNRDIVSHRLSFRK